MLAFFAKRSAQVSKTDVVFVSYETLRPRADVASFVKARRKDPEEDRMEIEGFVSSSRRAWFSFLLNLFSF